MQAVICLVVFGLIFGAALAPGFATPRLPRDVFDVIPPSDRIQGPRVYMQVKDPRCRIGPTAEARRRIVDLAMQEWAFFGSHTVDVSNAGLRAMPHGLSVAPENAETVGPVNPAMVTKM